jgi:hypothetical protein
VGRTAGCHRFWQNTGRPRIGARRVILPPEPFRCAETLDATCRGKPAWAAIMKGSGVEWRSEAVVGRYSFHIHIPFTQIPAQTPRRKH